MRIKLTRILLGAICLPYILYSLPAVALECTYGAFPFEFGSAEPSEGALNSETLNNTPLFDVIPDLEEYEPRVVLRSADIDCGSTSGLIELPIVNLGTPPIIRTINYNGNAYDVYATSEPWAGYIVILNGIQPFKNGDVLTISKGPGSTRPNVRLDLGVKFVKLQNPLAGTVGQLNVWLHTPSVTFDVALPDGRMANQTADFNSLSVNILGIVCSLDAPPELDFGDTPIRSLKAPGSIAAATLELGMNCGSGYSMDGQRIPDSMQVQFTGGTEPGLLDSDQDNVKFQVKDRLGQALIFSTTYEVSGLTDSGNLGARNAVKLSVTPSLKDLDGAVTAGKVTGNLGVNVIYK